MGAGGDWEEREGCSQGLDSACCRAVTRSFEVRARFSNVVLGCAWCVWRFSSFAAGQLDLRVNAISVIVSF